MSRITLDQFMNKYVGMNVGVPWGYAGECVSLVQRYINECHNQPLKRRGDAIVYGDRLIRDGVAKVVTTPKKGDIIVWGEPLGLINGKYYGHVAIYMSSGTIFDQNNYSVKPTRTAQVRPMIKARPIQYIRMNTPLLDGIDNKYQKEVYSFVAGANINIRANHSANAKIVGGLKDGDIFDYIQKYEDGNYVWVSDGTRWVAVREIKDGVRQKLWGKLQPQKEIAKPKDKWLKIFTTIKEYSWYRPTQKNKTVAHRAGVLKPYQYRHQARFIEYKVIAEKGNFKTIQLHGNKAHPLIDIYTGKGTEHAWEIYYK